MGASELLILKPGDRVDVNGVRFEYQPSMPDLAASASSEPPGFYWQWMVLSRAFESSTGETRAYDAGVLCSLHAGALHALTLPAEDGPVAYQCAPLGELILKGRTKKSLFGKTRLAMAGVTLSETFGFVGEVAHRMYPDATTEGVDRLGEFAAALGITA